MAPGAPGNISALAGGVIQSAGKVLVPGATMEETTAPQISALKFIEMSNVPWPVEVAVDGGEVVVGQAVNQQ